MSATLVVYAALERRLRESVADHLYSLRRYSSRPCMFLNLAVRRPPRWLRRVPVDLVVFQTTYLAKRGSPAHRTRLIERARPLKDLGATLVALPQDQYLPPAPLCEFVDELGVEHVFSVAPESEWAAIYPTVDRSRTRISHVLTGYLDPQTVAAVERAASANGRERPLDVGYRAKDLPAWLGRHAKLKADVGRAFADAAPAHGLNVDISTRPEDTLIGDDWMHFLLSCRYTIGVEGGASILDHDGSIRRCCERVLAERPDATFEELERECFPGRDGEFRLSRCRRGTSRWSPRAPARCWSRATTTACSRPAGTTSRCAATSRISTRYWRPSGATTSASRSWTPLTGRSWPPAAGRTRASSSTSRRRRSGSERRARWRARRGSGRRAAARRTGSPGSTSGCARPRIGACGGRDGRA